MFLGLDLEQGIIFKPFPRTGCNIANAGKLQNIIRDFDGVIKMPNFRMWYQFDYKTFLKRGWHLEAVLHPKPTST